MNILNFQELVLIMDTARFKYPPFWVPLRDLWDSMALIDPDTNEPRGYFVISRTETVDTKNLDLHGCMDCDTKWTLSHLQCCKSTKS